jgi:hypothetical protein
LTDADLQQALPFRGVLHSNCKAGIALAYKNNQYDALEFENNYFNMFVLKNN